MNINFDSTRTRVAAFGAALAVTFTATFGIGAAVGDVGGPADKADHGVDHGTATTSPERAGEEGHGSEHAADPGEEPGGPAASDVDATAPLPGLQTSQAGYTFELADTVAPPGIRKIAFTITGPDGEPVTTFDTEHGKELHLIAVRRDVISQTPGSAAETGHGFQHVHPVMDPEGTWTTSLSLTPGTWRLFADTAPTDAEAMTLGTDLYVPGAFRPQDAGATDTAATQFDRVAEVDGYTVRLSGDAEPGTDSRLAITVERAGRPVNDLQPYLEAYGHLVALRAGDLAYLHVHPDGAPGDGTTPAGPNVVFYASVPTASTYRLFFDFKHDDVVRTAAFTLTTAATTTTDRNPEQSTKDGGTPPDSDRPTPAGTDQHDNGDTHAH